MGGAALCIFVVEAAPGRRGVGCGVIDTVVLIFAGQWRLRSVRTAIITTFIIVTTVTIVAMKIVQ